MLTKNGKMYLKPVAGNYSKYFKDTNGNNNWGETPAIVYQNENYVLFCELGTDDTPATIDDYQWAHGVSGLTVTARGNSCYAGDLSWSDCTVLSASITVKNNTSSAIVVKELGLFTQNQYYTAQPVFLIAREVFDEPISIAAGESMQFSVIY